MGLLFKQRPNSTLLSVALLVAICSSLQSGYESSVLNIPQAIVEQFVNVSNYDQYGSYLSPEQSTLIWSLIVTQKQLGQLIGTMCSPFLCGWFGKKGTILFNTTPLCLGCFLQALSKWTDVWPLLLVGRFIWSVGCGINSVVIPMFLSEISPNKIRGGMASLHGMLIGAGSVVADVAGLPETLGTKNLWPFEYFIVLGLQIVQLVIFPFCYESPKDLYIRQNKVEKALKSLEFYHRYQSLDQTKETLKEYDKEKQVGQTTRMPIKQLWSHKDLRMSMLVGIGSTCCHAFGGMQIITNYTTEIFVSTGIPSKIAAYASLAVGCLRFLAVFPSIIIVERVGRRPVLLFSVCGCLICFIIMLICQVSYNVTHQSWQGYVVLVVILCYGFIYSIGCQTIGSYLPSEVIPTQQRAANQGVAISFRFIFAFIITFAFLPLQRAIGGFCWLMLIIPLTFLAWFMYRCMPETKDRTILSILTELNGPRNILQKNWFYKCCCHTGTDGSFMKGVDNNQTLTAHEPLLLSEDTRESPGYGGLKSLDTESQKLPQDYNGLIAHLR